MRHHVSTAETEPIEAGVQRVPPFVSAIRLIFLAAVVAFADHAVIFLGVFLLFLGFTQAYARYQSPLILKEALLVGFFLAGLVVLGECRSGGCGPSFQASVQWPCSSARSD